MVARAFPPFRKGSRSLLLMHRVLNWGMVALRPSQLHMSSCTLPDLPRVIQLGLLACHELMSLVSSEQELEYYPCVLAMDRIGERARTTHTSSVERRWLRENKESRSGGL